MFDEHFRLPTKNVTEGGVQVKANAQSEHMIVYSMVTLSQHCHRSAAMVTTPAQQLQHWPVRTKMVGCRSVGGNGELHGRERSFSSISSTNQVAVCSAS